MKIHRLVLLSGFAAVIALTGCKPSGDSSGSRAAVPDTAPTPAPASGRAIAITANDSMKFNLTEIRAKPGEALSVTLRNVGTMPKLSMGHNWVLVQPDTDLNALTTAAAVAAASDYIPAEFKDRIIAATKLLGPRESDTVTFNAPSKPGSYPFLCTFPGHLQVGMKGVLIVE